MPYSNAPVISTYNTHRFPLVYPMEVRPSAISLYGTSVTYTQDQGMVNVIPAEIHDSTGNKRTIGQTRLAIHAYKVGSLAQQCRGTYVWEKSVGTTYYYCMVNTAMYTSTDGITWTLIQNFTNNLTTPVRFTEFIDATNTKKLIVVDGIEGYVYTSNAIGTKITDANFPSPHVPFPVFLDGYLFLAKSGTGDIYNSNLNTPDAWTAGSLLSAEMYPDDIQALVKINNYLVAIGTQSCEYFYDAANPTGTPLARQEGDVLPFGTQLPNSIAINKNTVVMIANNNDGESTIVMIKDKKYKEINPSFLVEFLNFRLNTITNPTTPASVRGFFIRQNGGLFYYLSLDGITLSPNAVNRSFAYSFDFDMWIETRFGVNGTGPFPVLFNTMSISGSITNFIAGHTSNGAFFGKFEEGGTGAFTPSADDNIINSDGLVHIYQEVRTPTLDFGTLNRKFMNRAGFIITDYQSTSPVINVSWSDSDFNGYSNAVGVTGNDSFSFPFITQLGAFRRRSFKITYNGGSFMQFLELECDINKGQQ